MSDDLQLLPEWVDQEAVILAWPDVHTDWAPWLDSVRRTYLSLISAITQNNTGVILLVRSAEVANVKKSLNGFQKVLLVKADYNDTWCRDYGFLTCDTQSGRQAVEFQFNGWGQKFDASKDNQINQTVLSALCSSPILSYPLVAEGGALEIDDSGHLLSTQLCLLNPLRNGDTSLELYQQKFAKWLGATQTTILQHGHLDGDDTDGHIDTLVRFGLEKTLVVQSCFNRPDDTHYSGLSDLVAECRLRLPAHQIIELPLPDIFNEQGERLPASYANYLITNGQVLCPIYQQPEDTLALERIAQAYPGYQIVPIDSLPLIQQFGSVHCISMQVPTGTLKNDVCALFNQGVTLYDA